MHVSVDCGEAAVFGLFLHILGRPKGASVKNKAKAPGLRDITCSARAAYVYVDLSSPQMLAPSRYNYLRKSQLVAIGRLTSSNGMH